MRNFAMGAAPATWMPLNGAARPTFARLTGPHGDKYGVETVDGGNAWEWSGGAQLQVLALDLANQPSARNGPLHFTVRVRPQTPGTCLGLAVDPGWPQKFWAVNGTPWISTVANSTQG